LFFLKNDGLQTQAVPYRRTNDINEIVLDPNTFGDDGTIAITNHKLSRNGKYLGYATPTYGSDWQEIHIRDIATKQGVIIVPTIRNRNASFCNNYTLSHRPLKIELRLLQ